MIATTAHGAASDCVEGSATRERLERISRVAERALRVTETVLALARKDTECSVDAAFRPAEALTSLVGDALEEGEQGVALEVRPEAWGARMYGRSGHFEGMVQALLTNARDHGAASAPIRVVLELAGDTLCLTVDNRVTKQPSHRGLGIGSYLAQRLAGELAGTLTSARVGEEYRARFTAVVLPPQTATVAERANGHSSGRLNGSLA